jgi:hypothetical protein
MHSRFVGVCLVIGVFGCGGSPPARSVGEPKPRSNVLAAPPSSNGAEPPLTDLRSGVLRPELGPPIEVEPVSRYAGPEFETLLFRFAYAGNSPGRDKSSVRTIDLGDVVEVPGATLAFVAGAARGEVGLWIRRPSARTAEPVTGDVFISAERGPGVRHALRVKPGAPKETGTKSLEGDFLRALASVGDADFWVSSPFFTFMPHRLKEMANAKYGRAHGHEDLMANPGEVSGDDLYRMMETTTGRSTIQQAIQSDRDLALGVAREPRKLPLSAAATPRLPRADYAAMLAALGTAPPAEPLAQAAPADFWFLRARTFEAFFELLELAESFGQPAADALGGQSEDRGTTARYTAELGLERTELARVLGPSVIESVTVVGSDPYVHDGTDVTFSFKVTAPPLFDAALAKALARHAAEHGGVKTTSFVHEGVTVRVARSADGRVRQHRATVAGLELVSNSPAAIRRVIATALGKAPRLADETDFRYLTARDAGTPDEILAFLSDRFVLSVIGPAQKIAQSRRQIALAELSTPGFAALLFGWLNGKSPKDDKELVKGGELLASELKHADGAPIAWTPGKPASSRWGTTTHLEPLIDLAPVEKISATEQRAYEQFVSQYSALWSEFVDPIIVRLARSKEAPGRLEVALRALPLLRAENRELIQMVGSARVEVPPLDSGLRWVLAIGKEAHLRSELSRSARIVGQSLKFDWLGDSVMIGVADRAELTRVARILLKERLEAPTLEPRRSDEFDAIAELPLYAVLEVKNRVGAVVALGALRKMTNDFARDMLEWRDGGKHRDVAITDIAILPSGMLRDGGHVYYALCPNALVFSLNRAVLAGLIDDQLDGKAPRGITDKRASDAGQFVIELGTKKDGALIRTIGWMVAAELVQRLESRKSAEAILRGAPESRESGEAFRSLARAYLGHVPLTPDGNLYQYSTEGIRDPARGTRYAPIFPPTPVPGSPLAAVLARFVRMRSSISFDPEPGAAARQADTRSFSARFSLDLRK